MKSVFTFSGAIGSGKSTISKSFADRIAGKWNSFGNAVRQFAAEIGVEPTRPNLQRLGADAVETNIEDFCRRVLEGTGAGESDFIVIDGVRHQRVLECLRSLVAPRPLVTVFVDAPQESRLERLRTRDGLTELQIEELQKHSTETEVETKLRERADVIVSNSGHIGECVEETFRRIRIKRSGLLP